ncbi:MAG: zf-HC2 domain-containing protein [Elusimicrobiota bacterium]
MHEPFEDDCLLYHSGELPAAQRGRFAGHLAGCESCRDLLKALSLASKAAGAAARSLPEGRLETMAERVLGIERAPSPSFLRKAWRVGMALTALAVGVHVTTLFRSGGHELSWTNGLERDIADLGDRIDALDLEVEKADAGLRIEEDLHRLEEMSASLKRQLGRKQ